MLKLNNNKRRVNMERLESLGLSQPKRKRQFDHAFKAKAAAFLIISFIFYRSLFLQPNVACIKDLFQDATTFANRWLVLNSPRLPFEGNRKQLSAFGKAFIGGGQVIMNLWALIFCLIWIAKVKNMRCYGSITAFFLSRNLIFLNVQKFPFPENMTWENPGVFSFGFSYEYTRDFFYSGHTGTLITIFLEMMTLDLKLPASLAFLSMLFIINMVIVTRVHYVTDIVGALMFAIWYHRTVTRTCSFPFFVAKWAYEHKIRSFLESYSTAQENKARTIEPLADLQVQLIEIDIKNHQKATQNPQRYLK